MSVAGLKTIFAIFCVFKLNEADIVKRNLVIYLAHSDDCGYIFINIFIFKIWGLT